MDNIVSTHDFAERPYSRERGKCLSTGNFTGCIKADASMTSKANEESSFFN